MDDTLALRALVVVLADDAMRDRFMALTGYDAATLRARAGEADVRQAVRAFLAGHEPDLLQVANALAVPADRLLGHGR